MSNTTSLAVNRKLLLFFGLFLGICLLHTSNSVSAQTKLWAIRGGIAEAPENTLEGMNHVFDLGAQGTEIDIWNCAPNLDTGDMEIVVIHDRAVDRTTNGTGQVQNLSFDYLRTLDAGSHVHPNTNGIPFPGAKIPTLTESLNLIKSHDKDVIIHLKHDVWNLGGEVAIPDIAEVIDEVGFPSENLFTWTYLKDEALAYSVNVPGIKIIYQGGQDRNNIDWQELHDLGVSGVQIFTDLQGGEGQFSKAYVDEIHANGFFAFVNFPTYSELDLALEWDVEYVQHFKIDEYAPIVEASNSTRILMGDCNLDGKLNFFDISAFISLLMTGDYLEEADFDQNDAVNLVDIDPFIAALSAAN